MKIGDALRNHIKTHGISIPELEKKTGLKKSDIKNILYNKSKNFNKIKIMCDCAGFNILPITFTIKEPLSISLYNKVVNSVCASFLKFNTDANKQTLDEYIVQTYNYCAEENIKDQKAIDLYVQASISTAIKLGAIKIKQPSD